jgi:hypothetical protein
MDDLLNLVWANNTASGRTIIVLVVVVGTFGSLCAISHWRRYRDLESVWLERVRQKLRLALEARQAPVSDEQAPAPVTSIIDLNELAEGVPPQTIVGDRLHTIIKMKQARVKVNVDALQQSSILKESSKWTLALPAYVVSLVMMLGLLGTFIGLSLMVMDIQQALPDAGAQAKATEWAASVSSLGRILAGKKTAFSATLSGLFFSIIVSALNFALARAQSQLYDRLERFTSEELLPATMPAVGDETPWEKFSTQLGDSFEHLEALTKEQARSAEQMAAVEKTFATVISNIEAITQRAATAPLQGMEGEITNVIGQLTQVNGAIIGLTERLPQIVTAFRQTHQSTLSEIQNAMQAQQAGLDRISRVMQTTRAGSGSGTFGNLSYVAAGAAVVLLLVLAVTHFM